MDRGNGTQWSTRSLLSSVGLAELDDIEVQPCGALGSLSTLERVRVRSTTQGERSFIVKREVATASGREVVRLLDSARREAGFYAGLGTHAEAVALRCWTAQFDESHQRVALVLEDAGPQTLPTQSEGSPRHVSEHVMELLATLHSEPALRPPRDAGWCPGWRSSLFTRVARRFAADVAQFEELYAQVLPGSASSIIERFAQQMEGLIADWGEEERACLVHGDVRMDNVVRRVDGTYRLIDWQMVQRGDGAFDTAHFLAGSLRTEDLASDMHHLLDVYRESWRGDDSPAPTPTMTEDAVRRALLLVIPLNVIFGVMPADDATRAARTSVLIRYFTALEDWNSAEFLHVSR